MTPPPPSPPPSSSPPTLGLSCGACTDQFSDRFDGELSAADAAAFDAHLQTCPSCRAEYDAFVASLSMLHDMPKVAAPIALKRQITDRIHRQSRGAFFNSEHSSTSPFALLRLPYELFALVIFIAVGSLYMLQRSSPPLPPTTPPNTLAPTTPPNTLSQHPPSKTAPSITLHLPPTTDRAALRLRLREEGWDVSSIPAASARPSPPPPDHPPPEDGLLIWLPIARTPRLSELLRRWAGVELPDLSASSHPNGLWVRLL
jgi:hypothetical protein